MSHSTKIIINNQTNRDQVKKNLNKISESLGFGPVAGSVLKSAQIVLDEMKKNIPKLFKNKHGTIVALPSDNRDTGVMGPASEAQQKEAFKCIVKQIKEDFGNWSLPIGQESTKRVIIPIAEQILNEISFQGGVAGDFGGQNQIDSNQTIYWVIYYGTYSITQSEQGVIYGFGAAMKTQI